MLWKNVAAFAVAVFALCAAARAEEGKVIECSETAMTFDVPDFKVTCKDYSDRTALSNAGAFRIEVLSAVSEAHQQVLVVADVRAVGNVYLYRVGLEEDVHNSFSNETLRNWKETGEVAGYEFAEYNGRDLDENCIAFRRTMTRRNGGVGESGFGRKVIGFGCTMDSREKLVESLEKLDAPGG